MISAIDYFYMMLKEFASIKSISKGLILSKLFFCDNISGKCKMCQFLVCKYLGLQKIPDFFKTFSRFLPNSSVFPTKNIKKFQTFSRFSRWVGTLYVVCVSYSSGIHIPVRCKFPCTCIYVCVSKEIVGC